MPRLLASAATLAALAALLTGCGDDAPTPASESLPSCDQVWVAGEDLPEDYAGCKDGDGVLQVSEIKECTKTDQRFTAYGDTYYAILGAPIHDDGQSSSTYQELYAGCFGTDW